MDILILYQNHFDKAFLYLRVLQWAMGLVFHNGFPMNPRMGPNDAYYSSSNAYEAPFIEGEQVMLTCLKLLGIAFWSIGAHAIGGWWRRGRGDVVRRSGPPR